MLSITLQHGIIMSVVWCIVIPFGFFFSRYRKPHNSTWLKAHILCQAIALVLTLVSFALAVYLVYSENSPQFSAEFHHASFGLFITAGILIQYLFALCRPKNIINHQHNLDNHDHVLDDHHSKTHQRKLFEIFHRALAFILFAFAYWNIHTGIKLASDEIGFIWQDILLYTFIGTISIFFILDMYHKYY